MTATPPAASSHSNACKRAASPSSASPLFAGFSGELLGAAVPYPFWAPEAIDGIRMHRERIAADHSNEFETTYRRKDGSRFPCRSTVSSRKRTTASGWASSTQFVTSPSASATRTS